MEALRSRTQLCKPRRSNSCKALFRICFQDKIRPYLFSFCVKQEFLSRAADKLESTIGDEAILWLVLEMKQCQGVQVQNWELGRESATSSLLAVSMVAGPE